MPGQRLKIGHDSILSDPYQLIIKHPKIQWCVVWISHTVVKQTENKISLRAAFYFVFFATQ